MSERSSFAAVVFKIGSFLRTTRGLLVVAAILALTPIQAISFFVLLVVAIRLLPLRSMGVITRLLLSFSLSMCVVTFIAVGAWLLHVPITAPEILLLLTGMLAIMLLVQQRRGIVASNASWHTNRYELTALAVAVAAMFFVTIPVQQHINAAQLLRVISAGGDNSAHLDMVKASDLNQGIAYGMHNRVNPPGNAVNYPQGWHFNVAFYKWMSEPIIHYQNHPGKILLLFYSVAVAWFGLLVFFVTRLATRLVEFLPGKKHPLALIGVAAVAACAAIHWLLQLYTHGFEAQTASLTLLAIEALLIAEAYTKPLRKRYPLLLLAAIVAVGCNFIWVFIMPITCGAAAYCIIATAIALRKLPPIPIICTLLLLAALAVLQPLFYLIYPVTFDTPIILQRGDINATSMLALLTIFAVILSYLLIRWKQRPLRPVAAIATVALIFSLGLMAYQLHEIGELRYFYYKSTYTFIVLAMPLIGVVVYDMLRLIVATAKPKKIALGLLGALAIAIAVLVGWQLKDPMTQAYVDGSLGGMSGQEALAVIDQAAKGPSTAADTVFIGSCNRGDDIRASLFIASITFDPIRRNTSFMPGELDERKVFKTIADAIHEPGRHVTVVSDDQVVTTQLQAYLGADAHNMKVVNLDQTPATEPVSQCPDRTRDILKFPIQ